MNKQSITFPCYNCKFNEGTFTVYLFWPNGEWDENKYSLEEALRAYPVDQYEWVLSEED